MNGKAEFVSERLAERPKQVLLYIAKEGPKNKYQLTKSTGISHASMHELMKVLKNTGMVEGKTDGKARTGLDKISYGLTLFGFCITIRYADPKEYFEICSRWSSLDYLISKINSFSVTVGKAEAEKFVRLFPEVIKEGNKVLSGCAFKEMVISKLFSKLSNEKASYKKWIEVFVADKTLESCLELYLKKAYGYAKEELKWLEAVLNENENLKVNLVTGKTCK